MLEKQRTVTSSWYTRVCLHRVIQTLQNLRQRSRLDTWLLRHDNTSAHKAKDNVAFLVKSGLQLLGHPPCSPDSAPCDVGLFPEVKKQLKGWRFSSNAEFLEAWDKACADLPEEKCNEWFEAWFRRMERCNEWEGEYFELVTLYGKNFRTPYVYIHLEPQQFFSKIYSSISV